MPAGPFGAGKAVRARPLPSPPPLRRALWRRPLRARLRAAARRVGAALGAGAALSAGRPMGVGRGELWARPALLYPGWGPRFGSRAGRREVVLGSARGAARNSAPGSVPLPPLASFFSRCPAGGRRCGVAALQAVPVLLRGGGSRSAVRGANSEALRGTVLRRHRGALRPAAVVAGRFGVRVQPGQPEGSPSHPALTGGTAARSKAVVMSE